MLDAARKAVGFSAGRARADLDKDEMLALALTRLLEIIGEAAKNTTPATKARAPSVPWRSMERMRDLLIHGYYVVNLDVVWDTVTVDLPPLVSELAALERS